MHPYDSMQSESSIEINGGFQQAILSIDLYWDLEQEFKVKFLLLMTKILNIEATQ